MEMVLKLNSDFTPIEIVSWDRAIWLVITKRAYIVIEYAGRVIRSVSQEFPFPAVIALFRHAGTRRKRRRLRPSPKRWAVVARDYGICQYCGRKFNAKALTQDHVVPASRCDSDSTVVLPWNGKRVDVNSWENKLCACDRCNNKKGDKTPEEAGMRMLSLPFEPSAVDGARITTRSNGIPKEWEQFL